MRDGGPHPAAQTTVLSYTLAPGDNTLDMSITGSRLAVLGGVFYLHRTTRVIVWDWTMGQILFVRLLLVYDSTLMQTVRQGNRELLPVREVC